MPENRPIQPKVTLEKLLELKRHERPTEAFWETFDSRLREKQLAALIPVESQWSRWFGGIGRFAKVGLPLATAAVVAVAIISLNRQVLSDPAERIETGPVAGHDASLEEGGSAQATEVAESADVRTVVIEAAPSVVELASGSPVVAKVGTEVDSAQIARTLPWLANVDFKRDSKQPGIKLVEPLNIDRGPTEMAMTSFATIRPGDQPVWVPTEQNIREAVASEIGITPSRGDRANRAWMTRVIASNTAAKFVDSRVESEYPRELTRVGVTASTLSFKF